MSDLVQDQGNKRYLFPSYDSQTYKRAESVIHNGDKIDFVRRFIDYKAQIREDKEPPAVEATESSVNANLPTETNVLPTDPSIHKAMSFNEDMSSARIHRELNKFISETYGKASNNDLQVVQPMQIGGEKIQGEQELSTDEPNISDRNEAATAITIPLKRPSSQ